MNWERIGAILVLDRPATLWDCFLIAFVVALLMVSLGKLAE